jgi:hypothetical protein
MDEEAKKQDRDENKPHDFGLEKGPGDDHEPEKFTPAIQRCRGEFPGK